LEFLSLISVFSWRSRDPKNMGYDRDRNQQKKSMQIFPASSPLVHWSFSPQDPKRHQSQKQDEPFDITFHHLPIFGETIPLVYSGEFLTLATPSNWPFRLGIVNPMVWDPYCSLGQW
jgi:hypothetical protein